MAFIADPRDNKGMSTLPDGRVLYSQVRPYTVPETLEELTGPTRGVVALPIMLAWTGRREFDLNDLAERRLLYQIVLQEAQRVEELAAFLNGHLLQNLWHDLWLPLRVRQLWEQHFSELAL